MPVFLHLKKSAHGGRVVVWASSVCQRFDFQRHQKQFCTKGPRIALGSAITTGSDRSALGHTPSRSWPLLLGPGQGEALEPQRHLCCPLRTGGSGLHGCPFWRRPYPSPPQVRPASTPASEVPGGLVLLDSQDLHQDEALTGRDLMPARRG